MHFETMIFAAGIGSRLEKLGLEIPKILLPVWKEKFLLEPIMFRLIRQARMAGSSKIYIVVKHKSQYILNCLAKSKVSDIEIIEQEDLNGEAGGLFLISQPQYPILAIDADNYLADDTFFSNLINAYYKEPCLAAIGVKMVPDISRYANVLISNNNVLIDIIEKPSSGMEFGNIAKMGCYVLSPELINKGKSFFTDADGLITTTAAFANICHSKGKTICVKYNEDFEYMDIGTIDGYIQHLYSNFI